MLNKRKGKCSRRIFLVTDAGEEVNRSGLDVVLSQFEKMECKLNVMYVNGANNGNGVALDWALASLI